MSDSLRDIAVLALDCQAAGATPAYGDLLELGWAVCASAGEPGPVQSRFVVPRTRRPIRRAVRELTGWSEACIAEAVEEREAWALLREDMAQWTLAGRVPVPTVIHFARFELAFLRDLHERLGEASEFPFDAVCLHAIAARLFPELPRRNIRALAGFLGHSPELVRRSAGHVEATVFIWRALVPLLEEAGVRTWGELRSWLDTPAVRSRRARRVYPLAPERRRALPDRSGVYRFVRRNGDVIYVGKAASLKKRVASHFNGRARITERALELLTQVYDIHHTETPSVLEAALLETDEIKRLDPPYNVQLRSHERGAWFASRDLREAVQVPDGAHQVGPLPSERALAPLWALVALASGDDTPLLRALALAVPFAFLPEPQLFMQGWQGFSSDFLDPSEPSAARRTDCAARALWIQRGLRELDASPEDRAPDEWDLARVRRRLERNLVQTGLLLRRARFLCLLADASVAFRERGAEKARLLVISLGELSERGELEAVTEVRSLAARRPRALRERQRSFSVAAYDRLRVLLTELRRVHDEGGDVALRIGTRTFAGERLAGLLRFV